MFDRFTQSARQVVVRAQDEARALRYAQIDTEHQLLGLLGDPDSAASQVLASFGITAKRVRREMVQIAPPGDRPVEGFMPFTPAAKKVLELSLRESLSLGSRHVTPEHLLLGLVGEGAGVATQVLVTLGADATTIRTAVLPFLPTPAEAGPQIPAAFRPRVEMLPSGDPTLRRLLEAARDRAAGDARTEFGLGDLLASATNDEHASSVLASFGVDVEAVRDAIAPEGTADHPPD